jgi:hypothetical protein
MSEEQSHSYSLYSLGLLAVLFLCTTVFHAVGMFRNTAGCNIRGIQAGEFLAYCENERYSDYEHGAFHYNLEPGSVDAMRKADVLFLGNSRLQLGLDPVLLKESMSAAKLNYYVLGFGYSAQYRFAMSLIRRYDLRPKVLVINVDPFFEDVLSAPARSLLEKDSIEEYVRYSYRKLAQQAKVRVCAKGGLLHESRACGGDRLVLFRNRLDGSWRMRAPITEGETIPSSGLESDAVRHFPLYADNVLSLRTASGVEPRCTLLLNVPQYSTSLATAKQLARETGTTSILPIVTGLKTFDRSHLTSDSSSIWTAAILSAIGPHLARCGPK